MRRLLINSTESLGSGGFDPEEPAFAESIHNAWREFAKKTKGYDGIEKPNHEVLDEIADAIEKVNGVNVSYQELAAVWNYVAEKADRVPPGHPRFRSLVRSAVDRHVSGYRGLETLELPSLDGLDGSDVEIVPDNMRAVAIVYAAYNLDQMGLFDTVERVVELNNVGLLPLTTGRAPDLLDDYYWSTEDRISPPARHMLYSRILGVPGGDVSREVQPNSEFMRLWLRFLSALSEYDRENRISDLFLSQGRISSMTSEHVRKAGKDCAANISLHGYGGTHRAAKRLTEHIGLCLEILRDPAIRAIWGARTSYQVIERLASQDGRPLPNIVRHKTMAEAGKKILDLMARHADAWSSSPGFSRTRCHARWATRPTRDSGFSSRATARMTRAASRS